MTIKTEHAGAKNGGGFWGTRAEAKGISKVQRRQADKSAEADRERSRAPSGRGKDTRRWCGGHPGREHDPTCVNYRDVKGRGIDNVDMWLGWKILMCRICGKELDYWMPLNFTRVDGTPISEKRKPPEWVK